MAKADHIPDAASPDEAEPTMPETLLIPGPFVVGHDCELEPRGGELCESCQQPACSGSVSVIRCDCGQLFRVNLLTDDNQPHACPGCERTYATALIVCEPDNGEAFLEALAVVLRANGFSVAAPGTEGDDDDLAGVDDDDDQGDDDDDERDAVEDDAADDDAGDVAEDET